VGGKLLAAVSGCSRRSFITAHQVSVAGLRRIVLKAHCLCMPSGAAAHLHRGPDNVSSDPYHGSSHNVACIDAGAREAARQVRTLR
jgi:hypothetical protein